MRAAIVKPPRGISVGQRPDPVVAEPTGAAVGVVPISVCGSDLWFYG